ncbi:MAG: hypothetical protein AAF806_02470 [Bacteroidota bacterium]
MLKKLNPTYFWDTNFTQLDEEKNADYIIRRVFELGDIDEIGYVHGWYGTELCREALLNAEYLREAAIIQAMVFLEIEDKALFKSATKKQHHLV